MAFLYYIDSDGSVVSRWKLAEKPLLVGRSDFATVCIQDSSISRSHFLVLNESGAFFVVDLESQNGTFLNGEFVTGHRLHDWDVIQAGNSRFVFSSRDVQSRKSPTVIPGTALGVPRAMPLAKSFAS